MTDIFQCRTPKEIQDMYENGFPGAECDTEDTEKLLTELPRPLFGDHMDMIAGSGEGKLSLPYKLVQKFEPEFGEYERQVTGDCVSHSTRNAIDISRAVEILQKGEREDFIVRSATEGIYGSRGHGGQGMTCSGAARFVSRTSGVLLRKKYGNIDLRVYNGHLGAGWGRRGVPNSLVQAGKANQVKTVSLIRSVSEARDALANGYGISVCSGHGFSSRRDKYGIAKKQGSWAHAMAWIGCDDTREIYDETLFLVQNSWGIWNGGPKRHDQPNGSFWIREHDAAGMLASNGSYVISNVDGFPPRKVDFSGWDNV